MSDYANLIPVNVLTGFLGSGKTTLLRRLLAAPELESTAVLVNEFGEVGIDHHLVEHVSETTLLLDNGCVCCAIRDDLGQALRELVSRRQRGDVPPFSRLVIETSGLADPAPIAYTLYAEPVLQHHFRLASVTTTVDAVNGNGQLERFAESLGQVAAADRIVITKTDLVADAQLEQLRAQLAAINAAAELVEASSDDAVLVDLLTRDRFGAEHAEREAASWFASAAVAAPAHSHTHGMQSLCLSFDTPLDWTAFGLWLTMLLHRHGDRVLRVKAMLDVDGVPEPVLIDGAQHLVHPPTHLERWPDGERQSRVVFIVNGLEPAHLRDSLTTFNGLVCPPGTVPPSEAAPAAASSQSESRAPGSAAGKSLSPAVPAG